MPDDVLSRLLNVLGSFRLPLTRPGFANFLVIAVGWIQSYGVHAVTEALVVTGVAGKRHHEAFHRFFSRGTWDPDAMASLGNNLLMMCIEWCSVLRGIDKAITV